MTTSPMTVRLRLDIGDSLRNAINAAQAGALLGAATTPCHRHCVRTFVTGHTKNHSPGCPVGCRSSAMAITNALRVTAGKHTTA